MYVYVYTFYNILIIYYYAYILKSASNLYNLCGYLYS